MTKLMATTSSKQLKSSITVGFTCVHLICELFVHAPKHMLLDIQLFGYQIPLLLREDVIFVF